MCSFKLEVLIHFRFLDSAMPSNSFKHGRSKLPATLTASEYLGLLWQLRVILGEPEANHIAILPVAQRVKVVTALVELLELHHALWKPMHSEVELHGLRNQIRRWELAV